ncbi:phage tail assembly chaperone [Rahnella sp. ChDrAdgB13]|uniref:phage tail assembly chaperone n=1 Tax=Rahnella sp. ChDrAdgB13 TaxID=1850581 RepID=UPI001AD88812|nr:putative phage tail assembly chaperone [Rahnella sp. ChDrAdgB13]
MEAKKTITLDDVTYVMTPVNAMEGWQKLQLMLGAIGRSKMSNGGDGSIATAIALAFSVMDGKELAALQEMVIGSTVVKPEDGSMPFKLVDQAGTHFNQYRSHFPQLLVEGALYQFEDFFTGIRATLGSLFPGMGAMLEFIKKAREAVGEPALSDTTTETASTGLSGHP